MRFSLDNHLRFLGPVFLKTYIEASIRRLGFKNLRWKQVTIYLHIQMNLKGCCQSSTALVRTNLHHAWCSSQNLLTEILWLAMPLIHNYAFWHYTLKVRETQQWSLFCYPDSKVGNHLYFYLRSIFFLHRGDPEARTEIHSLKTSAYTLFNTKLAYLKQTFLPYFCKCTPQLSP